MTETIIIKGKETADLIKDRIRLATTKLAQDPFNIQPKLAVILVGHNPASEIYVKQKVKYAAEVGVLTEIHRLDEEVDFDTLLALIKKLNADESVNGVILQLPLPLHLKPYTYKAMIAIDSKKDADCFNPKNIGLTFLDRANIVPCTSHGVLQLLDQYNVEVQGKHVVIVGASNIVGKPLALELINRNATVSVCNIHTKNIRNITKSADILVVAIGHAKFFDHSYVNEDCVVIDVGINQLFNKSYNPELKAEVEMFGLEKVAREFAATNKLTLEEATDKVSNSIKEQFTVGDVDFHDLLGKCAMVSKVPGGVGLLTVANLLHNTLILTLLQKKLDFTDFGLERRYIRDNRDLSHK
ncbi:bifunctional 5,10-methylenetetrahydrofolate dehydrogenase/5,10-methenyltetrahydrofolate cyclohydrolase [Psittacicella hinzii]|uniref:bifunctional 5,10-methylenetetrahydrofolate dehydrogenase/5,10-methenyltetrahydrofolate cyclohydrolase n=1 Tax=Psittacicella hinzii TaxID=2028575 RepID=UPI0011C360E0|nr:bifunctional 5,10-methylenetetrahydrofolate dehydrogenase/5,10-methenyltetrahydrofolate cyclohydrolase [Psittacicella hinzii]